MTRSLVPASAVVVISDARKAVILRNEGDAANINLKVIWTIDAPPNPPTRLQGTARPGRTAARGRRSALEETDWHRQAEAVFAASLSKVLAGLPDHPPLVLAAPPSFLGELRLPRAVADRIIVEQAKDLTHLPVWEIEQALADTTSHA